MDEEDKYKEDEQTLGEEVRGWLKLKAEQFLKWMSVDSSKPVLAELLKYLYKIPVAAIALMLSPVALIVLLITFIIVL